MSFVNLPSTRAGSIAQQGRSYFQVVESQKLVAGDVQASGRYGNSAVISNDGTTMVVTARQEQIDGVTQAGAAYIYQKSGNSWSQVQKLVASDKQAYDKFGWDCSISEDGTIIVIGAAYRHSGGVSDSGAAYIFEKSGSSWSQVQIVTASDKQASDVFGYSCLISKDGSTIAIGAFLEDTGASGAGSVYIFEKSGSTWSQTQKIQASDRAYNDYFGVGLAMNYDGTFIAVGAHWEDPGVTDAGSVYIFEKSGSSWSQVQKIYASDPEASTLFGYRLDMNEEGNILVARTAQKDESSISDAGAVYVFERYIPAGGEFASWYQTQKLVSDRLQANARFGSDVAISGDGATIAVSAELEDIGSLTDTGVGFIFKKIGSTWKVTNKIFASDKGGSDKLGNRISINQDGTLIVVPAQLDDINSNTDAGSVYVFDVRPRDIVADSLILNLDGKNLASYSGTGTTWYDLTSNGNNATLNNNPTYISSPGSFSFDGINDYVSLGQIQNNVSTFTWLVWFKTSTNVSYYSNFYQMPVLIGTIQGSGDTNDALLGINNNKLAWYDELGGGNNTLTTTSVTDGNWHHAVVSRDTSTLNFYLDGKLVYTKTSSTQSLNSQGLEVSKANWTSATYYSGQIGSIQIYNKLLTRAEILKNYNYGKKRFS